MSVESNVELVKRYLGCMGSMDHVSAAPLLAENFTHRVPAANPGLGAVRNKAETMAFIEGMKATLERCDVYIEGITAQGNRVAVEAETRSVIKPDGRLYNNHYHFLFEVENGRITALREYCDTALAAETFGF